MDVEHDYTLGTQWLYDLKKTLERSLPDTTLESLEGVQFSRQIECIVQYVTCNVLFL